MSTAIHKGTEERLKCFLYHHMIPEEVISTMTSVRQAYVCLAETLVESLPEGRSKSLALTYLEDSLMRAIQSLALQGEPDIVYISK